ncbi:N-acetylneuraminate synthase family protein [Salinibacter ruber]|uniref:N-acetylneuraminate synthase family protein n=1 Tax=Salinibacter ruber TaxID=146919 RepID=UPI002167ECA4|nr:N-acetylneuraminate synthase family protein [Salinibacter ruber]MCS4136401.1 N-acetylneuraminate synthase [Salinibacter ruber]
MSNTIEIGSRPVGPYHPTYIIGEIGINHNGDLEKAKELIDVAEEAGCDAVKFQKRTPEVCVPEEQKDVMRDTPWGRMKYIDYKHHIEFGWDEFEAIDDYCADKDLHWFASCWDVESVEFMEAFDPVAYKVASASLTDDELIQEMDAKGRPMIASTGMSTREEIEHAVSLLDTDRLLVAHCTSTYPCDPEELNLRMIQTLQDALNVPIGYSGHEVGLQTTVAAVALGACFVERHITLDRAMWGSDQAASVEPQGLKRLVRDIRTVESALGDGEKKVYDSEIPIREKLRKS